MKKAIWPDGTVQEYSEHVPADLKPLFDLAMVFGRMRKEELDALQKTLEEQIKGQKEDERHKEWVPP